MGQFVPRTFETILERMINRVVARTDLNDINDGSSLKQVLAASAREDDEFYFQALNLLDLFDIDKATGADLDERAKDYNPILISRIQGATATGQVVFSRVGTIGTIIIPIGTQAQVPAEGAQEPLIFTTTEEGTILAGFSDSVPVDIAASAIGTLYNVFPNTIIGFVSKPSGVDTVSNPSALTNGEDLETDDAFRDRIKAAVFGLARCHVAGVEAGALTASDPNTGKRVVFSQVVEDTVNRGDVTLFIDDGSGTALDPLNVVVGESVLAVALGGEQRLFLANKPISIVDPFSLQVNAVVQDEDVDFVLNPASGQIDFLPANYPSGLTAGDAVTAGYKNYTGLVQITQNIIDGDPADRVNFPGFRAAGVLVRVLVPDIRQQVVTANITVRQGFNQDTAATQAAANVSQYINGLTISGDVILNEIRERIMSVPGMFDVSVVLPTENTIILDNQLARIIDSNITVV